MTQQELVKANDPDLRLSLEAMKRAAYSARKTAIQTDTAIVIVKDEQIIRVSADELRKEKAS